MSASLDKNPKVIWQLKDIGGYIRLLNTAPAPVIFFHRLAVAPFHDWFAEIAEQNNLGMRKARPGSRTKNLFEEAARIFKRISLEDQPSFGSNLYSKDTLKSINDEISLKLDQTPYPFKIKIVSGEQQRELNPAKVLGQIRTEGNHDNNNPGCFSTLEIGEQILNPSLSIAEKRFMLALTIAKAQAALYVKATDPGDPSVKFFWKIARIAGAGRDKESPEDKKLALQEVVANLLIAREMWRVSRHWKIRFLAVLNCPVGGQTFNKLPQFFTTATSFVKDIDFLPVYDFKSINQIRIDAHDKKDVALFTSKEFAVIKAVWNAVQKKASVTPNRERSVNEQVVSFREATSQAHWLAKKGYSASAVVAALLSAIPDEDKKDLPNELKIHLTDKSQTIILLEGIHLDKSKRKLAEDTKYPIAIPTSLKDEKNTPIAQNENDRLVQLYANQGQIILEELTTTKQSEFSLRQHNIKKFSTNDLKNSWTKYAQDLEGLVTAHFIEALRPEYDGTSYEKVSLVSQYLRLSYAHFLERIGKGRSSNKLRHEMQRHYQDDYDISNNFMREARGLSIYQTAKLFERISGEIKEITEKLGVEVEVGFREKEYGSVSDKVMRSLIELVLKPSRYSDYFAKKIDSIASYFMRKQLDLLGIRIICNDSEDLKKITPAILAYFNELNDGWDESTEINTVPDSKRTGFQLCRFNFKVPDEYLPPRKSDIPITGEIRIETERFALEEKVGSAFAKYCLGHWQMKNRELILVDYLRKLMTSTRHKFLSLSNLNEAAADAIKLIAGMKEDFSEFNPLFSFRDPVGFKNFGDFLIAHADAGKIVAHPSVVTKDGETYFEKGTPEEILVSVIQSNAKRNVIRLNKESYVREVPLHLGESEPLLIIDLSDHNRLIDWKSKINVGSILYFAEKLDKRDRSMKYLGDKPKTAQGILYNLRNSSEKLHSPSATGLFSGVLEENDDQDITSVLKVMNEDLKRRWFEEIFQIYAKWINTDVETLATFLTNSHLDIIRESSAYKKIRQELKEFKEKRFVRVGFERYQGTEVDLHEFWINFDEKQSGLTMKIVSLLDEASEELSIDYSLVDYDIPYNDSDHKNFGEGISFRIKADEELIEAFERKLKAILIPRNQDVPCANPRIRKLRMNVEFDAQAILRISSALYRNGQYISQIKLPSNENPTLEIEIWGEDIGIEYHAFSMETISEKMTKKLLDRDFEVKESIIRDITSLDPDMPGRVISIEEAITADFTTEYSFDDKPQQLANNI